MEKYLNVVHVNIFNNRIDKNGSLKLPYKNVMYAIVQSCLII